MGFFMNNFSPNNVYYMDAKYIIYTVEKCRNAGSTELCSESLFERNDLLLPYQI